MGKSIKYAYRVTLVFTINGGENIEFNAHCGQLGSKFMLANIVGKMLRYISEEHGCDEDDVDIVTITSRQDNTILDELNKPFTGMGDTMMLIKR